MSVVDAPKPKPKAERLSRLSKSEGLSGVSEKGKLQRDSLIPVVWSFAVCNLAVLLLIFILAILDHFAPNSENKVIDSKVIIAVVGGITIQIASVIIAAFKGLFR